MRSSCTPWFPCGLPDCNEHQIVVAAELNNDSPDFGHLEPMVCAAERELAGVGVAEAPAVVVADAGYWHHEQVDRLTGRGIQVLTHPTRASAEVPGRAGRVAATRSCAACSKPSSASSSTGSAR
jgi:hypothetical protein